MRRSHSAYVGRWLRLGPTETLPVAVSVSLGRSDHGRAALLYAQVSFPWPDEPAPLVRAVRCPATSSPPDACWAHASHRASQWRDLAEGRLRLDRLSRNGGRIDFLPLGLPPRTTSRAGTPVRPFLARQESLTAAILRCASARERVRRRSPPACRSPSRPRWSRARKQQGEVTWLTSALSRNPATSSRARSSPRASRP